MAYYPPEFVDRHRLINACGGALHAAEAIKGVLDGARPREALLELEDQISTAPLRRAHPHQRAGRPQALWPPQEVLDRLAESVS